MASQQHVQTHALERGLRAVDDARLQREAQQAAHSYDKLKNLACRFQIPVWGIATASVTWSKFRVAFDVQYPFAPEQQDDPYDAPHFSHGAVVSGVPHPNDQHPDPSNPDSLVAVHVQIVRWARDLNIESVVGAVVGWGATTAGDPATTGQVKFSGHLHLSFSGFGCVIEDDRQVAGDTVWGG